MKKNFLFVLILIFQIYNYVYAQNHNLKDLLISAIEKNLDIKAERLNIDEAKELLPISASKFEPRIEINIGSINREIPVSSAFSPDNLEIYREIGTDLSVSKLFSTGLKSRITVDTQKSMNNTLIDGLRPKYNTQVVFNITQPLLKDYGSEINNKDIEISKIIIQQAIKSYERRVQSICFETEILYLDLIQAKEILKLREFSKELTIKLLNANKEKFNAGLVPITEVQQAETALAGKEEEIIKAKEAVDIVKNKLKDVTVIDDEILINEIKDFIPKKIIDEENAVEIALNNRPEIDIQKLDIQISQINENYLKNQAKPNIDLVASAGFSGLSGGERKTDLFPFMSNKKSPYDGDYLQSLQRTIEGDGKEFYAGVRFSHSLDNSGSKANLKKTQLNRERKEALLQRLKEKITLDVKNSMVSINKAKERLKTSEEFVRLANLTLEQEMERFKAGLSDTFHILRFQEDLVNAKIKLTVAQIDLYKAISNLYYVTSLNIDDIDVILKYNQQQKL